MEEEKISQEYIDFTRKLYSKIRLKLYRELDFDIINSKTNLLQLMNFLEIDNKRKHYLLRYLSNSFIDFSNDFFNNEFFTEKQINFFEKYKIELKSIIEEFIDSIGNLEFSLNNINWVEKTDYNFKYSPYYYEPLKKVVDNNGIIMINTNGDNLFSDILVSSFILNNYEFTILTYNKDKKMYIEDWINGNKIEYKSQEIYKENLSNTKSEINLKNLEIRQYNSNGIKTPYVTEIIEKNIKELTKIIGSNIEIEEIKSFRTAINKLENIKNYNIEDLIKMRNNETDEYKKKELNSRIREISNNKESLKVLEKYNLDLLKLHIVEIKNFIDTKILHLDLFEEEERIRKELNTSIYANNISSIYKININSEKKVDFVDDISGIIIMNNIENISYELIADILYKNGSKISKFILIGDFINSDLNNIYSKTFNLEKIDLKGEVYES